MYLAMSRGYLCTVASAGPPSLPALHAMGCWNPKDDAMKAIVAEVPTAGILWGTLSLDSVGGYYFNLIP